MADSRFIKCTAVCCRFLTIGVLCAVMLGGCEGTVDESLSGIPSIDGPNPDEVIVVGAEFKKEQTNWRYTSGPTIQAPKILANSKTSLDIEITEVDGSFSLADIAKLQIAIKGAEGFYELEIQDEHRTPSGSVLITIVDASGTLLGSDSSDQKSFEDDRLKTTTLAAQDRADSNGELLIQIVAFDFSNRLGRLVEIPMTFFSASAGEDRFASVSEFVPLVATFTGGTGDPSVVWSQILGPGTFILLNTRADAGFSPPEFGTYVFKLEAVDPVGVIDVDLVTVTVVDGFSVDAGEARVVAVGDTVELRGQAGGGTGQATFSWEEVSDHGVTITNSAGLVASFVASEPGEFEFRLTGTDAVLGPADDRVIYLAAEGLSAFISVPANVSLALPLQLAGQAGGGFSPYAFRWSQLDGPSALLEDATREHARASLLESGTFIFRLLVLDSDGASAEATITLSAACGLPGDCDDENPCTDDSCIAGNCENTANVVPCNDHNACTESDICAEGVCIGTTKTCTDDDLCTTDTCGPLEVGCVFTPIECPDGLVCDLVGDCVEPSEIPCSTDADCDDDLYCTGVEACASGVCFASGDPCGEDQTCDEANDGCSDCDTTDCSTSVTLPDGTVVTVDQDDGAPSFANSRWQIRSGGAAIVTLVFDGVGSLTAFADNTLAAWVLGSELVFDATRHTTGYLLAEYSAVSFVAGTADGTGIAFVSPISVFDPTLGEFASGSATMSSVLDPNYPEKMTGHFVFDLLFHDPFHWPYGGIPLDTHQDFDFIAVRCNGSDCRARVPCLRDADCNDGSYCNGIETCQSVGTGIACNESGNCECGFGMNPCTDTNEICFSHDGFQGACLQSCATDVDCENGNGCPAETCREDMCWPDYDIGCCTVDADCDDGLFCNGLEVCIRFGGDDPFCASIQGSEPCLQNEYCDESTDQCKVCVVKYVEDFSSDPGWTTDQPGNYFWDAATETFNATTLNDFDGAPSPTRYAYTPVDYDGNSFRLDFDMTPTDLEWSAGVHFGLFDGNLDVSNAIEATANTVNVHMGRTDAGRFVALTVCGTTGVCQTDTLRSVIFEGHSYHARIEFKRDADEVILSFSENDSSGFGGIDFLGLGFENVGGLPADLDLLGFARDPAGNSCCPNCAFFDCQSLATVLVDNIIFCEVDPPSCSFSPTNVNFGEVEIGSYLEMSFEIENTGAGTLDGSVSESCSQFSIISGAGSYSLSAGQVRNVTLRFAPTSIGQDECYIDIGHDDCNSFLARGVGVQASSCSVSPSSLNFGTASFGFKLATIRNVGGGTLTGNVSESCSQFDLQFGSSGLSSFSLGPNEVFTFGVYFEPTSSGAKDCTINTGSNCSNLIVTGNGIEVESCYFSTEIIDGTGDGAGNVFYGPWGIAVDGAGNVYVTGFNTSNAFKITPIGTITEIIDGTGDGAGNSLLHTSGIAVDNAGNVFVTGLDSNNAFKITPAGVISEIIDMTGDGAGNVFTRPAGIAVDHAGNVFVTGVDTDNAFKITPAGLITEIIDATGDGAGNTFDNPGDVTVDEMGNVYVIGSSSRNAFKITPAGVLTEIIDGTGDGAGNSLLHTSGIAVDNAGNVYVSSYVGDNVFKITPAGVIAEIIDATGDGAGHDLNNPRRITVDGTGNVYVAGKESHNAFKITPDGVITEIIDATGDGAGNALEQPLSIAVDGAGNVYVPSPNTIFKITPSAWPDCNVP